VRHVLSEADGLDFMHRGRHIHDGPARAYQPLRVKTGNNHSFGYKSEAGPPTGLGRPRTTQAFTTRRAAGNDRPSPHRQGFQGSSQRTCSTSSPWQGALLQLPLGRMNLYGAAAVQSTYTPPSRT